MSDMKYDPPLLVDETAQEYWTTTNPELPAHRRTPGDDSPEAPEPTDREMLDWLETQKPNNFDCVLLEYMDGYLTAVNFCYPGYDDDSQFYAGDGWRSAIRAAMKDIHHCEDDGKGDRDVS